MRLVHEVRNVGAEPVIAARRAVARPHPLLHDRPLAVSSQEKTVMVYPEPILHGGGVHLGGHPAVVRESIAVHAEPGANLVQLEGRPPGDLALTARDIDAEVAAPRGETFLERAADGCRDPARVPVEPQYAAERLEPVWVGEPREECRASMAQDDRLGDLGGELPHAIEQPARGFAAVQRQRRTSGAMRHAAIWRPCPPYSAFSRHSVCCSPSSTAHPAASNIGPSATPARSPVPRARSRPIPATSTRSSRWASRNRACGSTAKRSPRSPAGSASRPTTGSCIAGAGTGICPRGSSTRRWMTCSAAPNSTARSTASGITSASCASCVET